MKTVTLRAPENPKFTLTDDDWAAIRDALEIRARDAKAHAEKMREIEKEAAGAKRIADEFDRIEKRARLLVERLDDAGLVW
jgi:hypothetical protein